MGFSRHPLKPLSTDHVLVEAVYGLGEGLVGGELEADRYEVSVRVGGGAGGRGAGSRSIRGRWTCWGWGWWAGLAGSWSRWVGKLVRVQVGGGAGGPGQSWSVYRLGEGLVVPGLAECTE